MDKCKQNKTRYPLDSDLFIALSAIQTDGKVCFVKIYSLDSNLSINYWVDNVIQLSNNLCQETTNYFQDLFESNFVFQINNFKLYTTCG